MELDDNKIEKLMQASVNMRDKIEHLEKEITDITAKIRSIENKISTNS